MKRTESMVEINKFKVQTFPMVTQDDLQRVDVEYSSSKALHCILEVYKGEESICGEIAVALNHGCGVVSLLLPVQEESFQAAWRLISREGIVLAETEALWEKPREFTMYVMISSHTDIGLHNSQYIQRYNSLQFLDKAKSLCDETADEEENNQYRYTIEGTWFWNNYGMDRGREQAKAVVKDYIDSGKIGVCSGVAGNHMQVFGLEEMCRSTYEKKRLMDSWGISSETMAMIDINGMPMSMIQPYAEAGYKNIIFAPNQWNPLPSTIWAQDMTKEGLTLNPDAGGGGSRIDVRYESSLPMVFFWEDFRGNRLLVWASAQYDYGGSAFGLFPRRKHLMETLPQVEYRMSKQLPILMEKYPYDLWLLACYGDDQEPNMELLHTIQAWNKKWKWPQIRTLGNPNEPFQKLREKYEEQIPVLRGDITGGWYQHPLSTPELLADKFEADRLLPNAEKWATVAAILDGTYQYPAIQFRRAWDYLLYNDEHSYGTSGYQGRRVYETWMQHRDWIEKAKKTANNENQEALKAIVSKIASEECGVIAFNPTAQARREYVLWEKEEKYAMVDIPSFGYRKIKQMEFLDREKATMELSSPPVIENKYYKVTFAKNGSVLSIFDKELNRELFKKNAQYRGNELVYTNDTHQTFYVPDEATFVVTREREKTTVEIRTRESHLGAEIVQMVNLLNYEKRIDIDNRLYHVKDMINKNRYHRYLYFAFPFAVDDCRRYCHLNGEVAEYARDVTGHGTDVYMAVNEWCCVENEIYGAALMMLDSQLVEFDHIHADKTDFGDAGTGSEVFAYVANDWLQMHTPGGSHLDYQFRYAITSYAGSYEQANIPQTAERFANPIQFVSIGKQEGILPADSYCFMSVDKNQRFLCMKRADDGNGIIVRLYGKGSVNALETYFGKKLTLERVRMDELPMHENHVSEIEDGFSTFLLGQDVLKIEEKSLEKEDVVTGRPAPIGSVYTGLITNPRAGAGEHAGHLYLLWGQNMEGDFSHYKLYRSEHADFEADDTTFIADVFPEEYCVGRYEDRGLKEHTCYYYKVCAVNRAGVQGEMSDVFMGYTRESIK